MSSSDAVLTSNDHRSESSCSESLLITPDSSPYDSPDSILVELKTGNALGIRAIRVSIVSSDHSPENHEEKIVEVLGDIWARQVLRRKA